MVRLLTDFKIHGLINQANMAGIQKKDIIAVFPYKDQVCMIYSDNNKSAGND